MLFNMIQGLVHSENVLQRALKAASSLEGSASWGQSCRFQSRESQAESAWVLTRLGQVWQVFLKFKRVWSAAFLETSDESRG